MLNTHFQLSSHQQAVWPLFVDLGAADVPKLSVMKAFIPNHQREVIPQAILSKLS
jgi:hypothetical protein